MAVAVIGSNSLSLGPIAPGISSDLEASVETVLYASAGYGLGTGFAALLLARWIDRFGPLRVLRVTFVILAVAFLGCAFANDVFALVLMQVLAGIATGVSLPAVYAEAARIAPTGHESRVLGKVLVGWTISLIAGVSLSALIADRFGWRSVFAVLCLLSVVVLYRFHRSFEHSARADQLSPGSADNQARKNRSTVSVSHAPAPSPVTAFAVKGVPLLLLLVACYMISFYASYAFVGDHVVQALQRPLSHNAGVAIAYGCGFGLAAMLDSQLDRFSAVVATPVTLVSLAALYLILFFSDGFLMLVGWSFVWGLFNHLAVNVLIARLSAADERQRGTVLGLYSGVTYLSMSLATVLAGLVYPLVGWPGINLGGTVLCTIAAMLSLPAARSKARA